MANNELEAQWTEPVSPSFHSALQKRYAEPFVGVSYHILVHLATRFQRRRFFKKSTNHKELPMTAMFVNGSGRN